MLARDRVTRWLAGAACRPSGFLGRLMYSAPVTSSHSQVLGLLDLGPGDVALEIGPGGGVFLGQSLERAGRAAAIDHSPDMVVVTRRQRGRHRRGPA